MKRKTRKKMRKNLKGGSSEESTKLTNILDTYKSSANKFFKAKNTNGLDTILLELDELNKPKNLSQYKLDAEEFSEFMQQWKVTYGAIETMIYQLTVDDETLAFGEQYSEPWQYRSPEDRRLSRSSSTVSHNTDDSWDEISQKDFNPDDQYVIPPAMLRSGLEEEDKFRHHKPRKPKNRSKHSNAVVTGGTKRKSLKKSTKKKSKKVFSIKRKPIIKGTRNIRNKRLIVKKTKRKNKKKSKKKYKKNIKGGMLKTIKEYIYPPIDYDDLNNTLNSYIKKLSETTDIPTINNIQKKLEEIREKQNINEEYITRINKLLEHTKNKENSINKGLRYRFNKYDIWKKDQEKDEENEEEGKGQGSTCCPISG